MRIQSEKPGVIDSPFYREALSSKRTETLFLGVTILVLVLLIWRMLSHAPGFLATVLLGLFLVFLFCSINYRTLYIRIGPSGLHLKFGLFTWTIPTDNIGVCGLDDLPKIMRYGGAGVHFMLIRGRYRVSFNFLEHPRVAIALKKKTGLVRDVSFSTQHPDEVIRLLRERTAQK